MRFELRTIWSRIESHRAFSVGPQATPPGTQVPHTLYVVLEGSALSSGALDTVNPASERQFHVLGEVELSGAPGLGDACQCGEATDDGAVLDSGDLEQIRDYLADRVTNPVIAAQIEARCSVVGTTDCNVRDLVFLKQALDSAAPSVQTRCDAALSPAQGVHPRVRRTACASTD